MPGDTRRRKPDHDDNEKRGSRAALQIAEAIQCLERRIVGELGVIICQINTAIEALQRPPSDGIGQIEAKLDTIIQGGQAMAGELEALQTQVAETNGAIDSAIVLIRGLRDAILNAGTDPAKLQALTEALDVKEQELASAVTETPNP